MSKAIAAAGPVTRSSPALVARHPNASVALGSGSGFGALVVWLVSLGGIALPPEVAAVIAGGIAATALFVGRRGIRGAATAIWRGEETDG